MGRLCFLVLIGSGLCIPFGLSGCGDNPCEKAEPTTCAEITYAAPDRCLVVEEDDFACNCCTADGGILCDTPGIRLPDPAPPDLDELETQWDENSKKCKVL